MNLASFKQSLSESAPPAELDLSLQALWQEAKGNWDAAHKLVQSREGEVRSDWVHAYLHRREGDLNNAGYWYRRAGKPVATVSLEAEWDAVAESLLAAGS
jgi:hypothetical protein